MRGDAVAGTLLDVVDGGGQQAGRAETGVINALAGGRGRQFDQQPSDRRRREVLPRVLVAAALQDRIQRLQQFPPVVLRLEGLIREPRGQLSKGGNWQFAQSGHGRSDPMQLGGQRVVTLVAEPLQGRGQFLRKQRLKSLRSGVVVRPPVQSAGEDGLVFRVFERRDRFLLGFLEVGPTQVDQRGQRHAELAAGQRRLARTRSSTCQMVFCDATSATISTSAFPG